MTTTQGETKRRTAKSKPSAAKSAPKASKSDARVWLRENGYDDIADRIEATIERWSTEGKSTRRNWWDTLSGGNKGRPYTIDGKEFPVLAAAQRRQGKPVTTNALQRNPGEQAPPVRVNGRWPTRPVGSRKKEP